MILLSAAGVGVTINAIRLKKKKKRHRRRAKLKVARFLQLKHFRIKRTRATFIIQRQWRCMCAVAAARAASEAAKKLVANAFVDIAIVKKKHRDKIIRRAQRIRSLDLSQKRRQKQHMLHKYEYESSESSHSGEYTDYTDYTDYSDYSDYSDY